VNDAPYLSEQITRFKTKTIDLGTLADRIIESDLTFGHVPETGEGTGGTGTWDTVRQAYHDGELSEGAFEYIAQLVHELYPDESLW